MTCLTIFMELGLVNFQKYWLLRVCSESRVIDICLFMSFQTLQCPDCNLKFPMKAVLKFHQDSAHQVSKISWHKIVV